MSNIITVHHLERKVIDVHTDAKIFKPNGRWKWLQSKAWNFLSKTNALESHYDKQVNVERYVIDQDKVVGKILNVMNVAQLVDINPSTVYMGPDEFYKVCYETNQMDLGIRTSFDVQIPINESHGEHISRYLLGLKVEVIPYMEGILVV